MLHEVHADEHQVVDRSWQTASRTDRKRLLRCLLCRSKLCENQVFLAVFRFFARNLSDSGSECVFKDVRCNRKQKQMQTPDPVLEGKQNGFSFNDLSQMPDKCQVHLQQQPIIQEGSKTSTSTNLGTSRCPGVGSPCCHVGNRRGNRTASAH